MEKQNTNSQNSSTVKTFAWILIAGSVLFFIKAIVMEKGYISILNSYQMTKDFNPPPDSSNMTSLIFAILEFVFAFLIFVSSVFVMKYKEVWRKILIFTLGASILVALFSPKMFPYSNYLSVIIALFLISSIVIFSKKEIKSLFG